MHDQLIIWYLDYKNNFLTVDAFADYHGVDHKTALTIISLGRELMSV